MISMWLREVRIIRYLFSLTQGYRGKFAAVVVLGIAAALAEGIGISFFIPLLQGFGGQKEGFRSGNELVNMLSGIFGNIPSDHRFAIIAACIFGSIVLKVVLSYSHTLLFRKMEAEIGHDVRSRIFHQVQNVGIEFIEKTQIGKLLNILSTETWRTGEALATFIGFIVMLGTALVYCLFLLLISWKLTLIVGLGMAAISASVRFLSLRAKRLGKQVTRSNNVLYKKMVEGIEGTKVIRSFGREKQEQEEFDVASRRVSSAIMKLQFLSGAVSPLYELLAAALLMGVLAIMLKNPANLPVVLVFVFVLYRLQPRIVALETARVHLVSLGSAVEEVASLLNTSGKPYIISGSTACETLQPQIEFCDVSFSYNSKDRSALQNVRFSIPAGKVTALVGPSGAGKTTIIHLLMRFYDPTTGAIQVDGVPLADLDLASWRRRLAFVSQEVYIFNTTIRQNIAFGAENASEEEIVMAAKLADAHDFIMQLPHGYETRVGDRGVRLSGGQKQRITLARAIVRNPAILILDEATNSLDAISEQFIQRSLERLRHDRTLVIIAHRLSTIESADHIVVLDQGRVKEQGTKQQLLQQNGLFAKLYRHQGAASADWKENEGECHTESYI